MRRKYKKKLGYVVITLGLFSSCIPICDSRTVAIFKNCTNDTLYIGASHFDMIDSVDCQLQPAYLVIDSDTFSSKVTLWNGVDIRGSIVYPDSSFIIDGNYLFNNTDTCYFFLIKWENAKGFSWDEIRTKKLFRRWIVTRDKEGRFDRHIRNLNTNKN
jgi:hypothetical protein